jgi:predicted metalloprotease with PDZ domain
MKVYWSGAALALMADVALRRRSGGGDSLDTVLGELHRCCLPSARTWSGIDLFGKLDEFLDEPVFMPLYRSYANASAFPDARPLLAQLGVLIEDGQVRLDDSATLAALRIGITQAAEAH